MSENARNSMVLKVNADEMAPQGMWNADLGDGHYKNPILYTDYSDPDVIRVGDDYYMIASSFCNAPAVPVLHSKDLVNWKLINYVWPHVPEERYRDPIHGCGVWAPSIRYHEGVFYACIPMPDEGIYMSTTKDPYGEWSKPVNIRPGAGWIDPCPFWDEDGRAYLVAGVAKSRIGYKSVLHMVEMQPDGMGLIGEEVKIFDGNLNDQVTIEGPKMYKRNGWYYIFAPAGGVKTGWQTVLRSRSPFGPYEYKVVMRQGDSPVNGPHQGAWVDTVTGEDWFVHFQDVYAAGRITHLQPMSWQEDWPIIGIAKDQNDYGEPVMEYKKPTVAGVSEITEPDTSDDFTGEKLGLQWQWNANDEKSWYECTGKGLKLHALPVEGRALSDMPNLLFQKWAAPEFTCITKMSVSDLEQGDCVGIVSMGMHYAALGVKKNAENTTIQVYDGQQKFNMQEVTTTQEIKEIGQADLAATNGNIWFLYHVERTGTRDINENEKNTPVETISLYYSLNGREFIHAHSLEATAGRWVGVKNGVFCIGEGTEGGSCKVEYVKYFKNESLQIPKYIQ